MRRTSTATHSAERVASRSTTRVLASVSETAALDSSSLRSSCLTMFSCLTICLCFVNSATPKRAPRVSNPQPTSTIKPDDARRDFKFGTMMHQLAARKQRPAARACRATGRHTVETSAPVVRTNAPWRASVLVLFVILVRLLLAYARRLPYKPAPLVRLAEELQSGERLHGVAFEPEHFGHGLKRLAFGVGHD